MRIGRTIPPAASPIHLKDILNGIRGYIRGPKEIVHFSKELKAYFGVKHCFLVSSGKAALAIILKSLHELHPGRNEVLMPAFCCYSVPSAIVRAGLKIRLCDVNPDTLDFDFEQLKKLVAQSSPVKSAALVSTKHLTGQAKIKAQSKELNETNTSNQTNQLNQQGNPGEAADIQPTTNNIHADRKLSAMSNELSANRLLAIIPVHLFGLASDIEKIKKLVNDPAVAVVEDAAQVMGSEQKGQKLGTIGDVGFFSLGRGKSISTVEGGIILTNNDEIAQQISFQLADIPEYYLLEQLKLIFQAFALTIFQRPSFFWFPKTLPFLRVGDTIYDPGFKIRSLSYFQAGLAKNWRHKLKKLKKSRKSNSWLWISSLNTNYSRIYCKRSGKIPDMVRFPVRIEDENLRKKILNESDKKGLGIMITYPDSVDGIRELKTLSDGLELTYAKKLPHQLITFPIHSLLSPQDRIKIKELISKMSRPNLVN